MSARQGERRVANSAADLVFYTDTSETDYPIYITAQREVWLKSRPHSGEYIDERGVVKRRYDVPIVASFYVRVSKLESDGVTHPLLDVAISAVREITKGEPEVFKYALTYEAHREDQYLGEAKAFAIKVVSQKTPFSGVKGERARAWAVAFTWRRRLAAKYPMLAPYTYVSGEEGKKARAYARLIVKLPVVTRELEVLFARALGAPVAATTDEEIGELERLIAEKERELAELKAKLEELKRLRSLPGRIASLVPVGERERREKVEAGVGA